jgi:hypothetical protein
MASHAVLGGGQSLVSLRGGGCSSSHGQSKNDFFHVNFLWFKKDEQIGPGTADTHMNFQAVSRSFGSSVSSLTLSVHDVQVTGVMAHSPEWAQRWAIIEQIFFDIFLDWSP